jgi:uncharacterized protein YcfJ
VALFATFYLTIITNHIILNKYSKQKVETMKNIVAIATALTMFGSVALADQRIQATVVGMKESYSTVVKQVPVQSCNTVEVPIYETRQIGGKASTGDTLAGALIGGVIGNQFGGGKGKDAATVLGAILGADAANKKGGRQETVIVGYRQTEQCTTTYQQRETQQRGRNSVTVETDSGERFTFKTKQWYKRGTIVFLNVSL